MVWTGWTRKYYPHPDALLLETGRRRHTGGTKKTGCRPVVNWYTWPIVENLLDISKVREQCVFMYSSINWILCAFAICMSRDIAVNWPTVQLKASSKVSKLSVFMFTFKIRKLSVLRGVHPGNFKNTISK